jgi:hypothetical protein
LSKLISYFFSNYNLQLQSLWFKRLIYTFLLIKMIYWLCYYPVLFGHNSISYIGPHLSYGLRDLGFLLYNTKAENLALYFILSVGSLCLLQIFFNRLYFFGDLLIWFLVVNLHNKIYPTLTGGNYLLNQLLFFNCFLSATFFIKSRWQNSFKILLHNVGVVGILVQVCLVYFLSALAKLENAEWLSGKAIASISKVHHFSLYSFPDENSAFNPAFVVLNYIVLFYQSFFPVLIWIRKTKKPLLITGIVMHLYIALVMGLVEFGLVMILSYIFFWPFKRSLS